MSDNSIYVSEILSPKQRLARLNQIADKMRKDGASESEIAACVIQFAQPTTTADFFQYLLPVDKKDKSASWLSQHAQVLNDLNPAEPECLIDRLLYRHSMHLFSASKGSFKSLLNWFIAKSVTQNVPFMGRETKTLFADGDDRPITFYSFDRENPESYARISCIRIGLNPDQSASNKFKIFGEWNQELWDGIERMDDARLIECAEKERCIFSFDSLAQHSEGEDENANALMTVVLNKGKSLSRMKNVEAVIILHHESAAGRPRGATAIGNTPDMSFIVERNESNRNLVTISEDRFRFTSGYHLTGLMEFGTSHGLQMNGDYTLTLKSDDSDVVKVLKQAKEDTSKDKALIKKVGELIAKEAKAGKPPMTKGVLAIMAGIKGAGTQTRILCQNTDDTPRPWRIDRAGEKNAVLFFPPTPESEAQAANLKTVIAGYEEQMESEAVSPEHQPAVEKCLDSLKSQLAVIEPDAIEAETISELESVEAGS